MPFITTCFQEVKGWTVISPNYEPMCTELESVLYTNVTSVQRQLQWGSVSLFFSVLLHSSHPPPRTFIKSISSQDLCPLSVELVGNCFVSPPLASSRALFSHPPKTHSPEAWSVGWLGLWRSHSFVCCCVCWLQTETTPARARCLI